MSRPALATLLAAVVTVALAACGGAADGPDEVDLEGRITAVTASAGDRGYMIEIAGKGLLPLLLPDARPPLNARGVTVEVPDGVAMPDDVDGRFDALADWVAENEESLVVVDYLN